MVFGRRRYGVDMVLVLAYHWRSFGALLARYWFVLACYSYGLGMLLVICCVSTCMGSIWNWCGIITTWIWYCYGIGVRRHLARQT